MDQISTPNPISPSYWCFQCTRIVNVPSNDAVSCPHCHDGFVQLVDPTDEGFRTVSAPNSRRAPYNPLVVLRNPAEGGSERISYDLFYDGGDGIGLRPLPSDMSETVLGSGFETMLDRLTQIGFSLWSRPENAPANKSAVAELPCVEITPCHVDSDLHCAVCAEAFALGSEGREMPCKHLFHSDCILPWLDLHNTCPLCRFELPNEESDGGIGGGSESVGLTIWRLPGGGFAVGRFVGGADGDLPLPAIYSEVDWALNLNGGAAAGNGWIRRRRGNVFRRFFGNWGSIFRNPSRRSSESGTGTGSGTGSIFSRFWSNRSRNSLRLQNL